MKFLPKNLIYLLLVVVLVSCEKEPGEGGKAKIHGKVWVKQYDAFFTILEHEYFGSDVKVNITYGDHVSPDESVNTNAEGEFEFIFLRKGKYKITLYSKVFKDSINPSGVVPVEKEVDISKRKETIDVGTLTIQK